MLNLHTEISNAGQDTTQAGIQGAKLKSHKEELLRAVIHGSIIAIALSWPTAWWKRIVGLLVTFFLIGAISQYRAIRRERSQARGTRF